MKKNIIYFLAICFICSFITSCAPMQYMQIATLKSEQVELQTDGSFKSRNSEFTIEYDFWSNYGNVGFLITNNSDKDLYLNLEKSYFINNGYAYDYYQNRVFIYSSISSSSSSSTASRSSAVGNLNSNTISSQYINGYYNYSGSIVNSNSYSSYSSHSKTSGYSSSSTYSTYSEKGSTIEYIEDKIVCIPAHSAKYFGEFQVSSTVYRECGFPRNPSKKEETILEFEEKDSPRVFENRLMFVLDNKDIPVNHKFYVCEIQNILKDNAYRQAYRKDCNNNNINPPVLVNKMASSDKYYLYYNFNDYNDDRINKK